MTKIIILQGGYNEEHNVSLNYRDEFFKYHATLIFTFYLINFSLMHYYYFTNILKNENAKLYRYFIIVILIGLLIFAATKLQYLAQFLDKFIGVGTSKMIIFGAVIVVSVAMLMPSDNLEIKKKLFGYSGLDDESPLTLWLSSAWFTLVSHTTVGFGDIYPTGIITRLVNMLYFILVFLPMSGFLIEKITKPATTPTPAPAQIPILNKQQGGRR